MANTEYEALKARLARGWNTWNVRSLMSHVLLPQGFSINLGLHDLKHTSYLMDAFVARRDEREERVYPRRRSYDGSFTELDLSWKELEVNVRSALDGDDLVLLVQQRTPRKHPPSLIVSAAMLWNRPGSVCREGRDLVGRLPGDEVRVYATGHVMEDPHAPVQGPYLTLPLSGPVGIGTGRARSVEEIEVLIERGRARQEARAEPFGELRDVYSAVQTCLAWDTIYEPSQERVVSPVSRIWSCRMGGYVLYCWDVYFAAYMAGLDHRDLAYANLIEMTREATESGFVPNFSQAWGLKSRDRSEPCVGSFVARELFRRYRETWVLEEVYPGLLAWNRWWHRRRHTRGLLSWGSEPYEPVADYSWESAGVNALYGAALESGLDNSPMYDEIPFDSERHVMELHDVGLNGLYVLDCESLADIAQVLGRRTEKSELRERGEVYRQAMAGLWDEQTGIFLNRRTDTGEASRRLSPTLFYGLLGGAATQAQAARMVEEHFRNAGEFWGAWMMPSVARNDPAFPEQNYWRGRIWPPMNFLVYLGLRRYKLFDAQRDLARKSYELLMKEWKERGYVCENYSALTGAGGDQPSSDVFYHWGGLLGMIALLEAGMLAPPEAPLDA